MPAKRPAPEDTSAALTPAERRAAKVAAWQERRRQRGKPTDGAPTYDVSACPPCGPPGGYTITNSPAPNEVEIHVAS